MIIVTLDTPNFSFIAIGRTQRVAEGALRYGWLVHQKQTGATMTADEAVADANFIEMELGECARDGEVIS